MRMYIDTTMSKYRCKRTNKEIEIFEIAQNTQIQNDIGQREHLSFKIASFIFSHQQSACIAAHRGQEYQKETTPVPCSVKEVACNDYQPVLRTSAFKGQPVQQKHRRQKKQIFERIKRHLRCVYETYSKKRQSYIFFRKRQS